MTTKIKQYDNRKAFEKDANKMAKDGWAVVSTSTDQVRRGCTLSSILLPILFFIRKKDKITVTYRRTD